MLIFYLICAAIIVAVIGVCFLSNRIYKISSGKILIIVLIMLISGIFGIHLLAFIEQGQWGDKSFCGCIFVTPIVFLGVSKILAIPYDDLMDICGPVCAAFLALIKINCYYQKCCIGKLLSYTEETGASRFPSQIIEGLIGVIICIVLLSMQNKLKFRGYIAPSFLMMFGISRFILNFFRANLEPFRHLSKLGINIPSGHLWALLCVLWGIFWIFRKMLKRKSELSKM